MRPTRPPHDRTIPIDRPMETRADRALTRLAPRRRSGTPQQSIGHEGLEEVGYLLAGAGPTPDVLDAIMGVLTVQYGYHQVSLHLLGDDGVARLAAQRGYEVAVDFDGTRGVSGGEHMEQHLPSCAALLLGACFGRQART